MNSNLIKIGLVGCGKISGNHLNALNELSNQFQLVAVCDNNRETLNLVTNKYKIEGFHHLEAMLQSKPELDIVTLCSPSGMHAQQTILLAKNKKHVITEKPMATRWSDGLAMVKACDDANVNLFVVKQNRYLPTFTLLKDAIKQNRFGKIYLANFNVFWTRPQTYYDQSQWRGTWEFDGGAFMNQACHYVDLLHWLVGPVQNVQAMMSTLAINMEAEDTGILNIRWRSGALGSMNVTMLTYPKNLESSITILGEKGSVKIGGPAANQILHWEFSDQLPEDEKVASLVENNLTTPHEAHKKYYLNVAETLKGEATPDTDGRAGLKTLEILVAAYISARDNKMVTLPLIY